MVDVGDIAVIGFMALMLKKLGGFGGDLPEAAEFRELIARNEAYVESGGAPPPGPISINEPYIMGVIETALKEAYEKGRLDPNWLLKAPAPSPGYDVTGYDFLSRALK